MEGKGKMLAVILVVAILVGVGLGVAVLSNGDDEGSITLNDALGREVTIEEKPSRIISVSPALTEMVYAFGEGDSLVGVTEFCDYPSEVSERVAADELETIGGFYYGIDAELIISLNPDVVFVEEGVTEHVSMVVKLEQANIAAVVMHTCYNSSLVLDNLDIMGKALHEEDKAAALGSTMENKFDAIANKVAESEEKPSVMLVIWWDSTSIWIGGDGSFIDEIIERAGAVNAFDDKGAWAMVTREDVVTANPDIIILAGMSMGNVDEALDALQNDELMDSLPAVINEKIYVILGQAENAFLRQSIRMVDATYLCAMMVHPEAFEDVLPKDIGNDYAEYLPITWRPL